MKNYFNETKKRLLWPAVSSAGLLLILEHYFVWGRIDILDFFGHEFLGIILLFIGIYGMSSKKWKNGLIYTKEKIESISKFLHGRLK